MTLNVTSLLETTLKLDASDLHLVVGVPPVVRIKTKISAIKDAPPLTPEDINFFLVKVLTEEQLNIFEVSKEVDFSVSLGKEARFRVNAYYQKGYPSAALRVIPMTIPTLDELGLPQVLKKLTQLKQGLILVVGPTGHGKSTTIASMLDYINQTRSEHIITIEDPIEYLFTNKLSVIEQREMFLDTHSWDAALRSTLRQDPNVVFVGEMRDLETIQATLTVSETGHLVFATLHTNSASQSIDRIIGSFPENTQKQISLQLAQVLEGIISQRLLHSEKKGAVPAIEILLATDAVRSLIRENKSYQVDNVINTSSNLGMVSLEDSLAKLVMAGDIAIEEALKYSLNPDLLRRKLKNLTQKSPSA